MPRARGTPADGTIAVVFVRIVNLTPHAVSVNEAGAVWTMEASGTIARVVDDFGSAERVVLRNGAAVEVVAVQPGQRISGLPAPVDGVLFLVSVRVAQAAPTRADLVFPIDVVRDGLGQVIGCRRLGRLGSPGASVD